MVVAFTFWVPIIKSRLYGFVWYDPDFIFVFALHGTPCSSYYALFAKLPPPVPPPSPPFRPCRFSAAGAIVVQLRLCIIPSYWRSRARYVHALMVQWPMLLPTDCRCQYTQPMPPQLNEYALMAFDLKREVAVAAASSFVIAVKLDANGSLACHPYESPNDRCILAQAMQKRNYVSRNRKA
jgi:hypothetical protein